MNHINPDYYRRVRARFAKLLKHQFSGKQIDEKRIIVRSEDGLLFTISYENDGYTARGEARASSNSVSVRIAEWKTPDTVKPVKCNWHGISTSFNPGTDQALPIGDVIVKCSGDLACFALETLGKLLESVSFHLFGTKSK